MRRTWPFIVAVAAMGGLAGFTIAGRPGPADPFVIVPSEVLATTTASSTTTTSTTTTSTTVDVSALGRVSTTIAVASEAPPPVPRSTTTTTTTPTGPQPALETTTTISALTTLPAPAPARIDPVRIVVANANGKAGSAQKLTGLLIGRGYPTVTSTDAARSARFTVIYFREGFVDVARQVAIDIGRPDVAIELFPDRSLTFIDNAADVLIVLGADIT